MAQTLIPAWLCEDCKHVWPRRNDKPPRQCDKCHSREWNRSAAEMTGNPSDVTASPSLRLSDSAVTALPSPGKRRGIHPSLTRRQRREVAQAIETIGKPADQAPEARPAQALDPLRDMFLAAHESAKTLPASDRTQPQAMPMQYQRPAHAPDCPCMVCGIGRIARAKDPK